MRKMLLALLAILASVSPVFAQNCEYYRNCGSRYDWRVRISLTPALYRLPNAQPPAFEQFRGVEIANRFAVFEKNVLAGYPLKDYGEPTMIPANQAPRVGTEFTLYLRRATGKYSALDSVNGEIALERRIWRGLWVEGSINAWTPGEVSTETTREFLRVNAADSCPCVPDGPKAVRVGRYYATQTDSIRFPSTYTAGLVAKYDLSPGRYTVIAPAFGGRVVVPYGEYHRAFQTFAYNSVFSERYATSLPNGLADDRYNTDGADQMLGENDGSFWQWIIGLDLAVGGHKIHNRDAPVGVSAWIRYVPFGGNTYTTTFQIASPMKEVVPADYQMITVSQDFHRWYGGFALTFGF